MTDQLHAIHDCYVAMTGKCVKYSVHEAVYHHFTQKGFTCDDLRLVLEYLASENRRMRGAQYSTRHDKLFDWDFQHFDSLLSEAKARYRNRRPKLTGKAKVLAQYERKVNSELTPVPLVAKSVKDCLRDLLK